MLNIMQESRSMYHAGVFWKSSAKRMAGLSQEQNESCRRGNIPAAPGAPNRGGGVGGVSTPPEFWMGGLNTCQPPLILRKKILRGVGSP